jgi:hypothetical protein
MSRCILVDEAWKDFYKDKETWEAFNNSEVFKSFARAELERDKLRERRAAKKELDEEVRLEEQFEAFAKKVSESPELKAHLKRAKAALEKDPELAKKVDPGFVNGIKLLNLED